MVNFTGQTKKRVVNLGGPGRNIGGAGVGAGARSRSLASSSAHSSSASSYSNSSFLEQSRALRMEREEQRAKEKAIAVIQGYIRRLLEMRCVSELVYRDWIQSSNQPPSDLWISQFRFMCKWSDQRGNRVQGYFVDVVRVITTYGTGNLSLAAVQSLVTTSIGVMEKFPELALSAIELLLFIVQSDPTFISQSRIDFHGSIDAICQHHSKIFSNEGDNHAKEVTLELVLKINVHDSCVSFLRFLSIPKLFSEKRASEEVEILREILSPSPNSNLTELNFAIRNLSSLEKVQLLANVGNVLTSGSLNASSFSHGDYELVGNILSKISFSIEDEYVSESQGLPSSRNIKDASLNVPSWLIANLEIFYSSQFIRQALAFLENGSDIVLTAFTTLLYFIPVYKNKFLMLVTITPGSYRWFYKGIKENTIYSQYVNTAASQASSSTPRDSTNFWKLVYTFEELYSYWLIISNDLESFSEQTLTIEEISEFMQFLKGVCLSVIFDKSSHGKLFDKLKDISIALLNQLYLKNLRLRFVNDAFWTLPELDFNQQQMIQVIAEREESRRAKENEFDDDDDEEDDEDTGQSKEIKNINLTTLQLQEIEEKDNKMEIDTFDYKLATESSSNIIVSKLEILNKMPFFVPFKVRVKIFQALIDSDMQKVDDNFSFYTSDRNVLKAEIRREYLLEDAFRQFRNTGSGFKNKLSVTFFNEQGGQEAGIDGGGITKEFLTSVVEEGFKPVINEQDNLVGSKGLFKETSLNQLYPNEEISLQLHQKQDTALQQEKLAYLRFLGLIIGKCFYESVLIDLSFAPFFLTKWCNANRGNSLKNSINDLNFLDKDLFNNLMKLTTMSDKELKALDLTFTIDEYMGNRSYSFDLIPNGSNTEVTSSNRLNYIHQVSNFKLNSSLQIQTKFFLEGLFEIIDSNWLSMFDAFELQMLISGGENDVNIQDWKENVEYGGYFDDDLTIVLFWEVVNEMTPQERFKLIKFVTSVSRAPLLGFGALTPKFGIRNSGRSTERLPTTSTCVNLLKLPDYQDKQIIRDKLLYVINVDARFDLS